MSPATRPTQPRIAPLPDADAGPDEQELFQRVSGENEGEVLNIFRTLARHPKLLKRWMPFANHVLFKSTLSPRHRELLILRVGWLCRSEYEWGQHVLIARRAGISDAEIARIADGPAAAGWDPFEATLLRAADELHADACLSDGTWRALSAQYGEEQIMDVVFTVGNYHIVSMALNSFGVQRDPGVPGFPA